MEPSTGNTLQPTFSGYVFGWPDAAARSLPQPVRVPFLRWTRLAAAVWVAAALCSAQTTTGTGTAPAPGDLPAAAAPAFGVPPAAASLTGPRALVSNLVATVSSSGASRPQAPAAAPEAGLGRPAAARPAVVSDLDPPHSPRPAAQAWIAASSRSRGFDGFQASTAAWKRSLIPLAATQALDIASSYGMRERNPLLAAPDGSFGRRAATIKISATAAIAGIEYLLVRKWPRAGGVLSKLNWSGSIVTGGLAAHNFAIR